MPRKKKKSEAQDACSQYQRDLGSEDCIKPSTAHRSKGKRFEIKRESDPKEHVCKADIDCLIPKPEKGKKKCDVVFMRPKTEEFYFVELKGKGDSNLQSVYKQIESTISYFREKLEAKKGEVNGYIVGSNVPRRNDQKFRDLQNQFRRDYGGEFKRGTQEYIKRI